MRDFKPLRWMLALLTACALTACGDPDPDVPPDVTVPTTTTAPTTPSPDQFGVEGLTETPIEPIPSTPEPVYTPSTQPPLEVFDKWACAEPMLRPKPKAPNTNGTRLPVYLQQLMTLNKRVWDKYSQNCGVSAPTLSYDINTGKDRFVSNCTNSNGQAIVVTPGYGRLFYCQHDRSDGTVVVPTGVFTPLWKNTNRKVADFAAAVSIGRVVGNQLIQSFVDQQTVAIPLPNDENRQRVASCLSGVFTSVVWGKNALDEKQTATALAASFAMTMVIDGRVMPDLRADGMAVNAFLVGRDSGNPGECAKQYWFYKT